MKSTYLLFTLFIFLLSCKENKNTISSKNIFLDSIKPPNEIEIKPNCVNKTIGYYKRFGLIISNFYKPIRITSLDFNNDGKVDTIVILKPFYMQQNERICFSSKTSSDNILIFTKNVKNKSVFFKK